jgi:hypothetical protein
MGARRGRKSLLDQTAEMRELMFAKSRDKSKVLPIPAAVRLRKREQESELKKWFCDTFEVNLGGDEEWDEDDT